MLHARRRPRYFENLNVSATEPCCKTMKSAEEPHGKSYEGLQILHEEIHIKKTHSGFIPLSLSDDEAQEEETKDIPFNKAFSDNKIVSSEPSDSLKNAEVKVGKCFLSSNNATAVHNRENNGLIGKHKNKRETEVYSTSTAFIGPIYKSEADRHGDKRKKYTDSNCQKVSGVMTDGRSKKGMTPKDAPPCDVPKIEDELSQFYSEINQLESDENCSDNHFQATETNSNVQPVEYNESNQIGCVSSREWSCRTSPNWGVGQCFYKESSGTGGESYTYNNPTVSRNGNGWCCNNERNVYETERLCNKQEGSRFWNDSVPQFKPSWQQTPPFIIPYGPPPPQFTMHNSFQKNNSSPFNSHISHSSNVGPYKNNLINVNCSTSDQSSEFLNHFGTPIMNNSGNGYNMPDGHMVNGFCETQGGWKDIKTCQNKDSSIISQQFPDNKLCESQKLLLILRGLPGSGKTTLSHILLGHGRDGIVFSTDDYFRQNNGCWSYNIGLLGAAHDWNQKRAKQAMDQGRSPIIIDNTNTQAWEMKPYVEAALEKGYRVEFHEPDTWWKFNAEELEKRNKHGVTREKIVQMLERYEYQMSIPIVMNSVLPFHKTSQRPPPQRRQRELVVKKRHRLHKMKQRRKRKNRKIRGPAIKAMGEKSSTQLTSSDEDSSQSRHEDSEDNGKPTLGYPNEPKEGGENGSANDSNLKLSVFKKGIFLLSSVVDPVTSGNSPDPDVLAGNSSLSVLGLPSAPNENRIEQSCGDHLSNRTQSFNVVESSSNIQEYNSQNSSLKFDHSDTDNSTVLINMKDKDTSAKVFVELGLKGKQSNEKAEAAILHQQEESQNYEMNAWAFFSFDLVGKKPYTKSDKSEMCSTWLEDTPEIIYDQRPKKVRKYKQVVSETTAKLLDNESSKELMKKENGKLSHENNSMTSGTVPSLLTKNTEEIPCTIIDFPTESGTKASVPTIVTILASPRKKERSKRIFKLAPKFDFPRQIIDRKEKRILNELNVLMKGDISNEDTRENNKYSVCCECPAPSDVVVEYSNFNVEYLICNDSNDLTKQSKDSAANVVAASVSMCPSISCEALLPCEQQTEDANREEVDKILPEVSSTQPDILYSVKELPECLTGSSAENVENTQKNEPGRHDQCAFSTESIFLRLPLSLEFAFQLVELFGSPGVSLDTLLPDDYVVPLEWAISKEIYLQWKTSVEKKQKNNTGILKEGSLMEGAIDQEDRNKDEEERDKPSEVNVKISFEEI